MSTPPPEPPASDPTGPADGEATLAVTTQADGQASLAATDPADVQATFSATLVDEWVRDGLTDAVVCPGSRSTPLALALADDEGVRLHVHHDERSAAFLALGIGLATGRPALVLTTSGTAAAELHPAVVEADLAAVPLLVCTADRPPELRDVGAPQAIDQVHLFGRSVRWHGDPGVPDAASADRWRAFAARAYATTLGARPGPVHLNLPFREPLVGTAGPLPPGRGDGAWTTVVPTTASEAPSSAAAEVVADLVGRRGLIVAGAADVGGDAVHETARALGWPVLAEPRSPAWLPASTLVAQPDALVRSPQATEHLRPDVIVRLGPPGASRVVNEWLAGAGARELVAGAPGWSDPSATAAIVIAGDASVLLVALREAAARSGASLAVGQPAASPEARGGDTPGSVGRRAAVPTAGWLDLWQIASSAAERAVADALVGLSPPSEPGVTRDVVRALPAGATLVVSSSMPIRDVERYAVPRGDLRVLANRGANGIDGVVSTAVGVAVATGEPTALLIGDVAFLHDSNGLLAAAAREIDLVCVVVDNDGGGIFSFLPQARALDEERFEALFGTPHGLDLVALASAYDVDARRLDPADDVSEAVAEASAKGGVQVLVVDTDRQANVAAHRHLDDAVATAVDTALTPDS